MITYNWIVSAFDCYPEKESQTDVVFNIHWRMQGTDENNNMGEVYSTQAVTYTAGSPFTTFEDITYEQAVSWLESSMGEEQVRAIKNSIDAQIENKINPPTVTKPAPWG
jgi:hypothetical protein